MVSDLIQAFMWRVRLSRETLVPRYMRGDDIAALIANSLASSLSRIKQTKSIPAVSPTKRGMELNAPLMVIKIT
jgi:hypothetical protein